MPKCLRAVGKRTHACNSQRNGARRRPFRPLSVQDRRSCPMLKPEFSDVTLVENLRAAGALTIAQLEPLVEAAATEGVPAFRDDGVLIG
eukprot:scaffold6174_cov125-Isochrysis_galbana.AAC.26